jgi:hypothetical protein
MKQSDMGTGSPALQTLIEAFNKYEGNLENAGDLMGPNTYGQTRQKKMCDW